MGKLVSRLFIFSFLLLSVQAEEFRLNNHISDFLPEVLSDRLSISGYGNGHIMKHNGTPDVLDDNFDLDNKLTQFRELSLFVDFILIEGLTLSTEIEFSDNFDNLNANYYYITADFESLIDDWDSDVTGNVKISAGKILVPFLSYNDNKPNFRQHLMSQPFTAWMLSPVVQTPPGFDGIGWADTGVQLNWTKSLGDIHIIDLKFALVNGLGNDTDVLDDNTIRLNDGAAFPFVRTRDGFGENEQGDFSDNNNDKARVIKLTYANANETLPFDIGLSYYQGAWDKSGDNDITMYGLHLNIIQRDWSFKAEYVHADVEQDAGVLVTDNSHILNAGVLNAVNALNTSVGNYTMNAWTLEASRVVFRYGPDDERHLRLIVRYDEVETNNKASFTPFDRSRITFGAEWNFHSNASLRYEYQKHNLHMISQAPPPFRNANGEDEVDMHMVSLIFWF